MQSTPLLEVCVGSVTDAIRAMDAGAGRLELCGGLELGGLTPSIGLLEELHAQVALPVIAMVRPRPGGFHYRDEEFRTALRDAAWLVGRGASGIAFGFLHADGRIDTARCREIVAVAAGAETVFHRAFDFVPDPLAAAEELVALGVTRILTSGGAPTAVAGVEQIRILRAHTAGRIEILPGGGVTAQNVAELLQISGCDQVHIGAARRESDETLTTNRTIDFVAAQYLENGGHRAVSPEIVAAIAAKLRS